MPGEHSIRAAIRHGAGLDMIPIEAATAAGVLVANVPGVNARSVAEHVMFASLALMRRFRMMDRDLRTKGWLAGREHANLTTELAGKTIGIVGLGAVGQAVGQIAAHGFGLNVIAYTRSVKTAPGRRTLYRHRRTGCGKRRHRSLLPADAGDDRPYEPATDLSDEAKCDPDQCVARPSHRR